MISIITPTHKEPPLFWYTVMSVLEQTSSDWEWVILDNSENEWTMDWFDNFWIKNERLEYLKPQIKVYYDYEHFKDIKLEDGLVGKLKNRCVEHTTCSDSEFILVLDHDDFLNTEFVRYVHKTIDKFPETELLISKEIFTLYYTDSGLMYEWLNDYKSESSYFPYELLDIINYDMKDYLYHKHNFIQSYYINNNDVFKSKYWGMDFKQSRFFVNNSFYCDCSHPRICRKDVLLKYGGLNDFCAADDVSIWRMLRLNCTITFLNYLSYVYVQYCNNSNDNLNTSGQYDLKDFKDKKEFVIQTNQYIDEYIKKYGKLDYITFNNIYTPNE